MRRMPLRLDSTGGFDTSLFVSSAVRQPLRRYKCTPVPIIAPGRSSCGLHPAQSAHPPARSHQPRAARGQTPPGGGHLVGPSCAGEAAARAHGQHGGSGSRPHCSKRCPDHATKSPVRHTSRAPTGAIAPRAARSWPEGMAHRSRSPSRAVHCTGRPCRRRARRPLRRPRSQAREDGDASQARCSRPAQPSAPLPRAQSLSGSQRPTVRARRSSQVLLPAGVRPARRPAASTPQCGVVRRIGHRAIARCPSLD
mmetsp:Transcript_19678/g.59673  ORF Transcript_19678/g.59673 Transcript_19678/m.59673 type:complete len:253 (-) Transcript_19678:264-1022(-)